MAIGSCSRLAVALTAPAAAILVLAAATFQRFGMPEARTVAGITLAYLAGGFFGVRLSRRPDVVPSWVVPVGLTLAVLETINIGLERFVGLPSPANAIVPASMMGLIVLFASTSAIVGSAGHAPSRGVLGAIMVIALGMLVACAAALVLAQRAAGAETEAFWRLMFDNTAMHLTLPPLLALVVSVLAVSISKGAARYSARILVSMSLAALPLLLIGVALLAHAASLPRAARPPLVSSGMGLSALALVCLPCFLARADVSTGAA
jgi:hypothetical protein